MVARLRCDEIAGNPTIRGEGFEMIREVLCVMTAGLLVHMCTQVGAQDSLPFSYTIETFQHEDEPDIKAFVVHLEQPFLAEEFEKSNYLRLKALDDRAFLIYPRETRFQQKHAEFYGRLRGDGKALLQLSYETVSENPDGSRRVVSRQAKLEVSIPQQKTGAINIYQSWAQQQNRHFADLLEYYPGESFFEFLLLQSRDRYGVTPPALSRLMPDKQATEQGLYGLFSSGLELQQSLQRNSLRAPSAPGDLNIHISQVAAPGIQSLKYEDLLRKRTEEGVQPSVLPVARLIPEDQYLLHFQSWDAADRLRAVVRNPIEPLVRMLQENSRDHHLWDKYESQLVLHFDQMKPLYSAKKLQGLTVTGSDFFVAEGTDLTVILETTDSQAVLQQMDAWVAEQKQQRPDMEDRQFNYRGLQIRARYTADRMISSFTVEHENRLIISNSHVGIRRIIDTVHGRLKALADAADYRYMTTMLDAGNEADDGFFYCSDAFLKYLFSPAFKVGERRRKQSLNNLVMLNNASLFYRLEYGRSPETINQLIDGRFIGADRIVCPQGGSYAIDTRFDTATNSVFNRIKYLTPIRELKVLQVSSQEKSEYERYRSRLAAFWQKFFTPLAVRISTAPETRLHYCLLPFSDPAGWKMFRNLMHDELRAIPLHQTAESVFASVNLLTGRDRVGQALKTLPGVDGVLQDDPTLTDLTWLGDRMSLNFCDAHTVLEVDPTRLRPLNLPIAGGLTEQTAIATALFCAAAPVYIAMDVEDQEKADRFVQMLLSRIFLHQQNLGEIDTAIDAYQLPEYKNHKIYVVTYRIYAARIRFYISVVGGQLIAATEPFVLNQVIDAAAAEGPPREVAAQLTFQLKTEAMKLLREDLRTYWEERARRASHRNIMPLYTLIHLYGVDIGKVDAISDAKYGVTYYCPDGEYRYDAERDRVYSTVYGDREHAMQMVTDRENSSFEQTFRQLRDVLFSVQIAEDHMQGILELQSR